MPVCELYYVTVPQLTVFGWNYTPPSRPPIVANAIALTGVVLLQAYFRKDGLLVICGWLGVSLHVDLER